MISKREKSKDYAFLFESIKNIVWDLFEVDYRPTTLIADAAGAITRGFQQAFNYNSSLLIKNDRPITN